MKQTFFYILSKFNPNISFGLMSAFLFLRGRIKFMFPNIKEKVYAEDMTLEEEMDKFMKIFMNEKFLNNKKIVEKTRKDMIRCYYFYGINPNEYFLHKFDKKNKQQRKSYISKRDKNIYCRLAEGQKQNPMNQLNDKGLFYEMAKDWFNRNVCVIRGEQDRQLFLEFIKITPSFIVKPISGSWGAGCKIYKVAEEQIFNELIANKEGYIIEELINQDDRIAAWNPTSVNTVRICSFRKTDGSVEQVFPFFKTGRKGSVVDNAGQGGVYASVDPKTGKICTDGLDESGHSYKMHPDSNMVFLGWQVPRWNELIDISKQIHQSLPVGQEYVGFDFALSKDKGWQVIEGNWGDFICQQSSLGRGIRKEIMKLYKEIA